MRERPADKYRLLLQVLQLSNIGSDTETNVEESRGFIAKGVCYLGKHIEGAYHHIILTPT
jgi:hypothetical protein